MDWSSKRVLVTGGASFIGSHLVDALVDRGARVRVVDNLSSGELANIEGHIASGAVEFRHADLLDSHVAAAAASDIDVVFHNAADHGGRGYIDLHQVNCSTNMVLDGQVFRAAEQAGVEKVVFASSGCVYPEDLQTDPEEILYLSEDLVVPPYNSDNLYGWAKLMAELTLRAYHAEGRMNTACCRYFTAYGPRCPESHAVMAMIARAFSGQDPFEIWGTGEQVRNWTHVSDIVEGTIRAAERIDDGSAVNVGTMERTKVVECAKAVLAYMGKDPELVFDPSKPTGPYNRVCDLTRCREVLGWEPQTSFIDGLHATIDWYVGTHDVDDVRQNLEHMLTERQAPAGATS
ncbi:MAG: NAD-dependent epimerase/dehydratase family protein [Thermoleophilia bacterium]